MPKKRKVGRPKGDPKKNRSEIVLLRLTKAERVHLERAAGGNLSDWMRHVLLPAAGRAHKTKDGKRGNRTPSANAEPLGGL
jgi:hypothetical protein